MTEVGVKRRYVDVDSPDTEVGTSKRRRFEPDNNLKVRCLQFIFICFVRLFDELCGIENIANIHYSNIVTSAILTGFNALKQEKTQSGSMGNKLTDKSISCIMRTGDKKQVTYTRVKEIIKDVMTEMRLSFPSKGEVSEFVGTTLPILTYSYLNKLRRNELRVGHSRFDVRKGPNVVNSVESTTVGIDGALHILCEGLTFPPERKSSMCQALGPLTMAVELARSLSNAKFASKWVNALSMSIAHIPHKNDIIAHLKNGNGKTCAPLITSLGKLLLITGERHTQRASIPANMWIRAWFTNDIEKAKTRRADDSNKFAPATLSWDADLVAKCIDFSGDGLWRTYQRASELEWETMGSWNTDNISQVTFHPIFGTYKENLSLLAMITNVAEWKTRKELANTFEKSGTSKIVTKFRIPKMRYFSKMSSASPTGIFAGRSEQVCTSSPFAGKQTMTFGEKFFSYVKEREQDYNHSTLQLNGVIAELNRLTAEQVKKLEDVQGKQSRGNTNWWQIDELEKERDSRSDGEILVPQTIRMFVQD